MGEDVIDLLDVFRAQLVLILALSVFPISLMKRILSLKHRLILVNYEYTSRNTCSVKERWRQTNNRFNQIVVMISARMTFSWPPRNNAVRHDRRHHPVPIKTCDHMLDKHQVGLPRFGCEAIFEATL